MGKPTSGNPGQQSSLNPKRIGEEVKMRTGCVVKAVTAGVIFMCAVTGSAQMQPDAESIPRVQEFVIGGYPPLARHAKVEGDVTALVRISEDGSVSSVSEVTGPTFLRGVADTLKEWHFDARSTTSREVRITLRFILSGREDVRNLTMRVKGKLPNIFEITTNPTSEKPGPDVRR